MHEHGPAPAFATLFGANPEIEADAPGRVNLIGEHTDYHHGFVLPAIIPQRTRVQLRRRSDGQVRVWSSGGEEPRLLEYRIGAERAGRGWLDYVQGVTSVLGATGVQILGVDLRIESDVPIGSGLSSSAALEISIARALRQALYLPLDDVELALLAQRAETEFVGVAVGIMDQMASSLGRDGEALFLDTRSLDFERLSLPASVDQMVIDSGVTHQHAGGAYATRRAESFEAAAQLGVERLRDLGIADLKRVSQLPSVLARRARHIITENARVLEAREALRRGDMRVLGRLFNASHASMRDDYETSTPEIDTLVALAQAQPEVWGARLTGGGFGGSCVILVHPGTAVAVAARVLPEYRARSHRDGRVVVPMPGRSN